MSDSFATPESVARQPPLSVGFLRQEQWSGLPFPPTADLPNSETEPTSPTLAGGFFTTEPPGKPLLGIIPPNYAMLPWREPWSWKPNTWRYKSLQVPPGSATCLALILGKPNSVSSYVRWVYPAHTLVQDEVGGCM